jgi:hypothetical protein
LSAYEEYNRFLRNVHNKEKREGFVALGQRISEVIDEKSGLLN